MSTYTITQDNVSTGVLADYQVVAIAEFNDGDLAHWEWMMQVQEEQDDALAETGEQGAILLVWKGERLIAGLALGNAIID